MGAQEDYLLERELGGRVNKLDLLLMTFYPRPRLNLIAFSSSYPLTHTIPSLFYFSPFSLHSADNR